MKILITGAAGFVGAACVDAALAAGHQPLAVVRPAGNHRRLIGKAVEVLPLDLADRSALDQVMALRRPDVIIHTAWSGVSNAARHDKSQLTDNIAIGLALVEAAAANHVGKFIGIGSQGEYGLLSGKIAEAALPAPTSLYGAAKLAMQVLGSQLCAEAGVEFAWLRLFSTYGPNDNPNWLIPSLITQMLDGQRPKTTEGRQRWDYLYIDDVAAAILAVAEHPDATGVFNLGSGQPVPVRRIVEAIGDLAAPGLELVFGEIPYQPDQIWHMEADIERLTRLSGFIPRVGLVDGLSRTIAWHKASRAELLAS
jgi:nucleoside-diphosphate-sugar epimerase